MLESIQNTDFQCPYRFGMACIGHKCPKWTYILQVRPRTEEELFLWCSCFSKDGASIYVKPMCPLFNVVFNENSIANPSKERNPKGKTIPDVLWCNGCIYRYGRCGG